MVQAGGQMSWDLERHRLKLCMLTWCPRTTLQSELQLYEQKDESILHPPQWGQEQNRTKTNRQKQKTSRECHKLRRDLFLCVLQQ